MSAGGFVKSQCSLSCCTSHTSLTLQRRSKNTVASYCLPQARLSLTAAQEMLSRRSWVTALHQTCPGCLWLTATAKRLLQPEGKGQQPSCQECPRQCSTSCVRKRTQGVTKVVHMHRFHQISVVSDLALRKRVQHRRDGTLL